MNFLFWISLWEKLILKIFLNFFKNNNNNNINDNKNKNSKFMGNCIWETQALFLLIHIRKSKAMK